MKQHFIVGGRSLPQCHGFVVSRECLACLSIVVFSMSGPSQAVALPGAAISPVGLEGGQKQATCHD